MQTSVAAMELVRIADTVAYETQCSIFPLNPIVSKKPHVLQRIRGNEDNHLIMKAIKLHIDIDIAFSRNYNRKKKFPFLNEPLEMKFLNQVFDFPQ